jgi:hypothetical protein
MALLSSLPLDGEGRGGIDQICKMENWRHCNRKILLRSKKKWFEK